MFKKFIILVSIIFSLNSCGYTPIYLNKQDANFNIVNFELEGDNEINNIISNKLKKYFGNNNDKKFKLKVLTNYEKISVAKDTTGKTTNFELIVNLNLFYSRIDLADNEKEKMVKLSENIIIKRDQNNYEQNNYERIIVKNMSELLVEKIVLHLSGS